MDKKMGLLNQYEKSFYGEIPGEISPKDTIFPFFGFQHKYVDTSYDQYNRTSDTITISGNTATYKKGVGYYSKRNRYNRVYERVEDSTGKERELEDRFVALQREKNKGKYDTDILWSTKYVCPSLREYVNSLGGDISQFYFYPLIPLFYLGWIWTGTEDFLRNNWIYVLLVALVYIGIIVFSACKSAQLRKKAFHQMPADKYQKFRKKYFKSMAKLYGEDCGKILEEYAVLKGYDSMYSVEEYEWLYQRKRYEEAIHVLSNSTIPDADAKIAWCKKKIATRR